MSVKYCFSVLVFHFWPKLTLPAARSLCVTCLTLPSSNTPKTSTDASTPGWLDVCYVTGRPYGAAPNQDGRCLEAIQAWRSPDFLKYRARGHWKASRDVSLEEDVERDTSATLSIGGPVVYWLVVEPTVVLHQQFVERWFSGNRSGRVVEARRPVVLKTRVVLQNVPERLDCVPDRATRQIVGRRWTRV